MNLGVEGMMFMGAITGLVSSYYYEQFVLNAGGNPSGVVSAMVALIASFIAGAFGALIYSFLTITLRANQNVTGLTLTIFGTGFATWSPTRAVLVSIVFGGLTVMRMYISIPGLPTQIYDMIPYIATILVLVFTSMHENKEHAQPKSCGINYFREER